VGVTAEEVAPRVYLALGIRGDTIHNAAISGAAKVIAVYADASAPLLKLADMAVVAEPKAFARELLAALQ
jgi:electron transfer flavoprotein alpha subunit